MRVAVIGLGYIGLPTATMFASRRMDVLGVDVSEHVVDTVNKGKIHIVEPELDILVHSAVSEGYLRASTEPKGADAFLIAVPTPFKGEHQPDLAYVESAARAIAPVLERGNVVILESTSPVGTTAKLACWLAEERPDLRFPTEGQEGEVDVNIAYCPERVLPGRVVHELVSNDRIIGGVTHECAVRACDVYRVFVQGDLLITNARTAEMSKLTENAFRDVNIAFANELSIICRQLRIDVWELIRLANHHPRVNILKPGCGVGGHCIAVDPWFIVDSAPELARIIRTAREVNDSKPHLMLDWVRTAVAEIHAKGGAGKKLTVAVLGLAFKPDIDDLRESPALEIAEAILAEGLGDVVVVEPNIERLPASLAGASKVNLDTALEMADVVVVLVAHRDFSDVPKALRDGVRVIDAVGICPPEIAHAS